MNVLCSRHPEFLPYRSLNMYGLSPAWVWASVHIPLPEMSYCIFSSNPFYQKNSQKEIWKISLIPAIWITRQMIYHTHCIFKMYSILFQLFTYLSPASKQLIMAGGKITQPNLKFYFESKISRLRLLSTFPGNPKAQLCFSSGVIFSLMLISSNCICSSLPTS